MAILVHIRRNVNSTWDAWTTVMALDGVLGTPKVLGLSTQEAAVNWLCQHVDDATFVPCGHLFHGQVGLYGIGPDEDFDVEIDVPYMTVGVVPSVVFRKVTLAVAYAFPVSENITGEDPRESAVDLLQIMNDICGA